MEEEEAAAFSLSRERPGFLAFSPAFYFLLSAELKVRKRRRKERLGGRKKTRGTIAGLWKWGGRGSGRRKAASLPPLSGNEAQLHAVCCDFEGCSAGASLLPFLHHPPRFHVASFTASPSRAPLPLPLLPLQHRGSCVPATVSSNNLSADGKLVCDMN